MVPNNNGLPFGPHPHRGMETVTFILDGDISHKDSGGHESVIYSGGVQWMTAGSGLLHAEVSSDDFKKFGGDLEILQLWVNLPARLKMTEPNYKGLQQDDIPTLAFDEGMINARVVSGNFQGTKGAFDTLTDITLNHHQL
jgi:quercetin 2,3-dioxygenase